MASPVDEQTKEAASASAYTGAGLLPELPTKDVNRNIAILSTLAAVGLFLSSRLDFGVSLKDLAAVAMPYEEVLSVFQNIRESIELCFNIQCRAKLSADRSE